MGSSKSKQVNSVLNREAVNVTTDIINRNQTRASASGVALQEQNITIRADEILCNLSVGQEQTQKVTTVTQFTNETTNELKAVLETTMNASLEQLQELNSELGGGWGSFVNQDMRNKVQSEIDKQINTSVTTENINEVITNFQAEQGQTVVIEVGTLGTPGEPCTISQNQYQEIIAEQVVGNVVKNVMDSSTVSEITTEIQQKQEVKQKGLAQLVTSIGDAVSSVISAATLPFLIGVAGVILFILLGGGLMTGGGGGGDEREPMIGPQGQFMGMRPSSRGSGTGRVVVGIVLVIVALTALALIIVYWPSEEERIDPPEEVSEKECVDQWKAAQQVKKDVGKVPSSGPTEKQVEVLLESEGVLCDYASCMGQESEGCTVEGYARQYKRIAVPRRACPCAQCVLYVE